MKLNWLMFCLLNLVKARGPPYRSSRKISYRIRQIISSLNMMGCRPNFSYQKLLVSNFLVVIYLVGDLSLFLLNRRMGLIVGLIFNFQISMHILIFVLIFVRMPGETAETENVPHSSWMLFVIFNDIVPTPIFVPISWREYYNCYFICTVYSVKSVILLNWIKFMA